MFRAQVLRSVVKAARKYRAAGVLFFAVRAAGELAVFADDDDYLARILRKLVEVQIIDEQHEPVALQDGRSVPFALRFHSWFVDVQRRTQHRVLRVTRSEIRAHRPPLCNLN
jgi:hypothetical protein